MHNNQMQFELLLMMEMDPVVLSLMEEQVIRLHRGALIFHRRVLFTLFAEI